MATISRSEKSQEDGERNSGFEMRLVQVGVQVSILQAINFVLRLLIIMMMRMGVVKIVGEFLGGEDLKVVEGVERGVIVPGDDGLGIEVEDGAGVCEGTLAEFRDMALDRRRPPLLDRSPSINHHHPHRLFASNRRLLYLPFRIRSAGILPYWLRRRPRPLYSLR